MANRNLYQLPMGKHMDPGNHLIRKLSHIPCRPAAHSLLLSLFLNLCMKSTHRREEQPALPHEAGWIPNLQAL